MGAGLISEGTRVLATERNPGASWESRVGFESRAMGSPLRLTVAGAREQAGARHAWDAVRAEFEACEAAMSRFRESSEMTALNRAVGSAAAFADRPRRPSRRLERALVAADRAHRITDGRFDPRVVRDLERLGDVAAPQVAGALAGDRDPSAPVAVRTTAGVAISAAVDLGGIGKGLALRWAARLVRALPCDGFLLEAGGDIVAGGAAPGGGPWQVGIEDPHGGKLPLAVIAAGEAAVATSSIRIRRWMVHGRSVHHLIDPRTGEPGGDGLASVTVAAADPAWAEVWSKALFLEGRRGIAELGRARGLAAWWVTSGSNLEMTAAARVRTVWVRDEAESVRHASAPPPRDMSD